MSEPTGAGLVGALLERDQFSRWLGIRLLALDAGSCTLGMTVREEMVNGFGIAHGGICYSLADSALAFASNSRGLAALSIETAISHIRPLRPGDILRATAREKSLTRRLGLYEVTIEKEDGELVALFRGTVYRKSTPPAL
ncbi:MAG TPA: hydroxyphenylacetyl-CoA thioesterase PaaI [Chitinophagaceae bacterium]|nr:hydroxyphenylacetyl-CoA thioesterase PaaI [Chitinophagaceae bacterium]